MAGVGQAKGGREGAVAGVGLAKWGREGAVAGVGQAKGGGREQWLVWD